MNQVLASVNYRSAPDAPQSVSPLRPCPAATFAMRYLLEIVLVCFFALPGVVPALAATYPDVNEREGLQQVIRERAEDGQLLLFTYHVSGEAARIWQDMALQMCDQLNDRSLPYIVLAHDVAGCDELLAAAAGRLGQPPYCVVDGMTRKSHRFNDHGTVLTLWVRRYHTAALLAEAGVSVTLLDADTVITRDFLPVLKELERDYALICLGESPVRATLWMLCCYGHAELAYSILPYQVNGGTWHLRASNSSSAALWVIKQIERRSTLFIKFEANSNGVDPGLQMDQEVLGEALRVASAPKGSEFDFWGDFVHSSHKDHELWQRFPQTRPSHSFQWKEGPRMSSPFLHERCYWDDATCARYELFVAENGLRSASLLYADLRVPFDSEMFDETAPPEKVLRAPTWLFSMGKPLLDGFDDQIAAYHLLGTPLYWANKDGSFYNHASRYAQWLARPGMRSYREQHGKPYVALAQHLVDAASTSKRVFHIKRLVKHLLTYAIGTGKMAIMPRFPCNASWISRSNTSFLGHGDHRVIDDGAWCYPSVAGEESCFPGTHYTYPFLVPPEAPVQTLQTLPHGLVADGHAESEDGRVAIELGRARKDCAAFFKELA